MIFVREAEPTRRPHKTRPEQRGWGSGPISPTPVMFVNMMLNTRRVMFSSSKAAICV